MNPREKRRIIDRAVRLYGDQPSLEKTIAIAVELYPAWGAPNCERLLRAVISFELSEAYKRHRFIREAADERGLDRTMSIRQIRKIFGRGNESKHAGSSRATHHP